MSASLNSGYFDKYCSVLTDLLCRDDKRNPALKCIIRHIVREAANHAGELPGYDGKLGAAVVSAEALKQIRTGDLSGLVGEHVVPVSIVNDLLLKMEGPSLNTVKETIRKFSLRAVITESENQRLVAGKLTKKMPPGWDGESIMSRYEFCNIAIKEVPYKEALRGD